MDNIPSNAALSYDTTKNQTIMSISLAFMRTIVLFAATLSLVTAALAQDGTIKVFQVSGVVELVNEATGQRQQLRRGQEFGEGNLLESQAGGTAYLVLSNGSSFILQENTSIEVQTLQQSPYNRNLGTFTELEADPSPSDTTLYLNYGQIVGKVRELRADSTFEIETAVGTAGIRGTGFEAVVEIIGDTVVFTFTNLDGLADLETFNPENVQLLQQQAVNQGQQIVVTATIDDQGNITSVDGIEEANVDFQAVQSSLQQILNTHQQAQQEQEIIEEEESGAVPPTPTDGDTLVDDGEDGADADTDTDINTRPDEETPPTSETGANPSSGFGGIEEA